MSLRNFHQMANLIVGKSSVRKLFQWIIIRGFVPIKFIFVLLGSLLWRFAILESCSMGHVRVEQCLRCDRMIYPFGLFAIPWSFSGFHRLPLPLHERIAPALCSALLASKFDARMLHRKFIFNQCLLRTFSRRCSNSWSVKYYPSKSSVIYWQSMRFCSPNKKHLALKWFIIPKGRAY